MGGRGRGPQWVLLVVGSLADVLHCTADTLHDAGDREILLIRDRGKDNTGHAAGYGGGGSRRLRLDAHCMQLKGCTAHCQGMAWGFPMQGQRQGTVRQHLWWQ